MDNATAKLFGQNSTNMACFLTVTDQQQPRIAYMPSNLMESCGKEIHTFQVGQSSNVAHHTVVLCPSEGRTH
jgi:hypothetical protein